MNCVLRSNTMYFITGLATKVPICVQINANLCKLKLT